MKRLLNNKNYSWSSLYGATLRLKYLFVFLIFAILFELSFANVLSLKLEKYLYNHVLLSWNSKFKFEKFINNNTQIVDNPKLGWVNNNNFSSQFISFNGVGSRSVPYTGMVEGKNQIAFFGDSYIGGGPYISNEQTINHYLNTDKLITHNFGTEYYSSDQVLLSLPDMVTKFDLDHIVIGLNTEKIAFLSHHFLPFVDSKLKKHRDIIPLLKPKYSWNSKKNELLLSKISSISNKDNLDSVFDFLKEDVDSESIMKTRMINSLMPFKSLFNIVFSQIKQNYSNLLHKKNQNAGHLSLEGMSLFNKVIGRINDFCVESGIDVVFLVMPSQDELAGDNYHYDQIINSLIGSQINYIDGSALILNSKGNLNVFSKDNYFSGEVNKLFANKIKSHFLIK